MRPGSQLACSTSRPPPAIRITPRRTRPRPSRPGGWGDRCAQQLRQRRRGQGQHRLYPRRRDGARAIENAPPVHAIVHDASGKSIVIEYVGGKLNVYVEDAIFSSKYSSLLVPGIGICHPHAQATKPKIIEPNVQFFVFAIVSISLIRNKLLAKASD